MLHFDIDTVRFKNNDVINMDPNINSIAAIEMEGEQGQQKITKLIFHQKFHCIGKKDACQANLIFTVELNKKIDAGFKYISKIMGNTLITLVTSSHDEFQIQLDENMIVKSIDFIKE